MGGVLVIITIIICVGSYFPSSQAIHWAVPQRLMLGFFSFVTCLMCVVLDNADLCLAHIHGYCVEEPDGVLLFPSRNVLFSALTSICDELMIDLPPHSFCSLRNTIWKSQLRRRRRNYDSTALMQLLIVQWSLGAPYRPRACPILACLGHI